MVLPLQKDDYMPEGSINRNKTLDSLIEFHLNACTWAMAITEIRFIVDGKTSDLMLLGEVLPHYGHP